MVALTVIVGGVIAIYFLDLANDELEDEDEANPTPPPTLSPTPTATCGPTPTPTATPVPTPTDTYTPGIITTDGSDTTEDSSVGC